MRYFTQENVAMPFGYTYGKKSYCGYSNQFVSVQRVTAGKEIHVYFKTNHFYLPIANNPRADFLQQAWAEPQNDARTVQMSSEKKR